MKIAIDCEQADIQTKINALRTMMTENLNAQESCIRQLVMLMHESNSIAKEIGIWEAREHLTGMSNLNPKVQLIRASK